LPIELFYIDQHTNTCTGMLLYRLQ